MQHSNLTTDDLVRAVMNNSSSYLIRVRLTGVRPSGRALFNGFSYISYTGVLTNEMRERFNAIYDLATRDFVKFTGKCAEKDRILKSLYERCRHVDQAWMVRHQFAQPKLDILSKPPLSAEGKLSPPDGLSGSLNLSARKIDEMYEDRPLAISSSFHEDVTGQPTRDSYDRGMFDHWLEK